MEANPTVQQQDFAKQLTLICTAALPCLLPDGTHSHQIQNIFLRPDGFMYPDHLNELDFLVEAACVMNADQHDIRYVQNIRVQKVKDALSKQNIQWKC